MSTEAGIAFPLLPGKRDALDRLVRALTGERKSEYDTAQATVLRESWFVQSTPQGDLIIVHFDAPDVEAVFAGLATSQEPFDVWFRDQVLDITGVDLSQPSPGTSECVFQWRRK